MDEACTKQNKRQRASQQSSEVGGGDFKVKFHGI